MIDPLHLVLTLCMIVGYSTFEICIYPLIGPSRSFIIGLLSLPDCNTGRIKTVLYDVIYIIIIGALSWFSIVCYSMTFGIIPSSEYSKIVFGITALMCSANIINTVMAFVILMTMNTERLCKSAELSTIFQSVLIRVAAYISYVIFCILTNVVLFFLFFS